MNRHQRRAAAARGVKVAPKTANMRAFERELAANVRTLRPELTVLDLLRSKNPAHAVVRVHDKTCTPAVVEVSLPAPVGYSSGAYTEMLIEHFDALVALKEV